MDIFGYIIVDANTDQLDWDGDLHETKWSAIRSLTGRGTGMCRTEEEAAEDEDLTPWWENYNIHPVMPRIEVSE